jgi:hypothetical protein
MATPGGEDQETKEMMEQIEKLQVEKALTAKTRQKLCVVVNYHYAA